MEIIFPTSLEARLSRLATQQGRDSITLIIEAVERMVDHDAWFVTEVERGLLQVEQEKTLSHDEVGSRIEACIASHLQS